MCNNWLFAAFMVSAENGILSRQNGILFRQNGNCYHSATH